MSEMPSVEVVIPFAGRTEYLQTAIASCLGQTYVNTQITVINDSLSPLDLSTLEADIRARFGNAGAIKLVQSTGKPGASGTRNFGLKVASADYVAFLDDDDYFLPNKLEKQVDYMERTKCEFSHTDYWRTSRNGLGLEHVETGRHGKTTSASDVLFLDCLIATPTVMLKRRGLSKLQTLFPETVEVGEDILAWAKLLSLGVVLGHVHAPLTIVRLGSVSIQRSNPRTLQEKLQKKENEVLRFAEENQITRPKYAFARNVLHSIKDRLAVHTWH